MKKTWIIIIGVLAVIAAAVAYLMLTSDKVSSPQDTAVTSTTPQTTITTPTGQQAPTPQPPGTYVTYDAEVVAKDSGRKVLFFHAPWCPQCRALEQSIKADTIPSGVTIYKTDFDSFLALRQKYGVTRQTTFVEIDAQGKEVGEFYAYYDTTLDAVVKGLGLK